MDDFLIRFKNSVKQSQLNRKKKIKALEAELNELEMILSDPVSRRNLKSNPLQVVKRIPIFTTLFTYLISICDVKSIEDIFVKFSSMAKMLRSYYNYLQKSINAFDNEKVISPLQDLFILIYHLRCADLSIEEKSRILGMAIYFDSQYALKHKSFRIKDINAIHALKEYYNQDGTFKYNENIDEYLRLLNKIGEDSSTPEMPEIDEIFSQCYQDMFQEFAQLLISNNDKLKQSSVDLGESIENETSATYDENREDIEELHKYYKNGKLISLPTDLTSFYNLLDRLNFSLQERRYICNLISEQLSKIKTDPILKYLSDDDKKIYLASQELLTSFKYTNGDFYVLKQFIEELQTISTMLKEGFPESDIEYLLSDVPKIIFELKKLLDAYTKVEEASTNNLVFLSSKLGIPYALSDIESLDSSKKKQISQLFSKLDMGNKSQFIKILGDKLPYTMYAIKGSSLSLTFVELDTDTYLIIGLDLSTNGYRESCNRLKSNKNKITLLKETMKNPEKRDEILKFNEPYLESLEGKKNAQKKKSILTDC